MAPLKRDEQWTDSRVGTIFKPKVIGGFAQRGHRWRNKRTRTLKPRLTIKQILAWADAHYQRTGKWPNVRSGRVYDAPSETWGAINMVLQMGHRGLAGGTSLAKLLVEQRGMRSTSALPRLTIKTVLVWADTYYERSGRWPTTRSGNIEGSFGETWKGIDRALNQGRRGFRTKMSLAKLLAARRHVHNRVAVPPLTIKQILAWADAHHKRMGAWPTTTSGPVYEEPAQSWVAVSMALAHGYRGLAGGTSLPMLLAERRGVRHPGAPPRLSIKQILAWADAYHEQTGQWPTVKAGTIEGSSGETWARINRSLCDGRRGLPAGGSLARLLAKYRRARNHMALPSLSIGQILKWADAEHRQTDRWPTSYSGRVTVAPRETWLGISSALYSGGRGLPGGTTLRQLLIQHGRIKPDRRSGRRS